MEPSIYGHNFLGNCGSFGNFKKINWIFTNLPKASQILNEGPKISQSSVRNF
jgi:hypothetical protein